MRTNHFYWVIALALLAAIGVARAEDVSFADANLEAAIRTQLGIPAPTPITDVDMAGLSILEAWHSGIASIQGLEYATNLTYLNLNGNQISDMSPVTGLTKLTHLDIWDAPINDISFVSGLTNLTFLSAGGNDVSDMSAVAGLTKLTSLSLECSQVSEVSGISEMKNIEYLFFTNCPIETVDLRGADLSSLKLFDINGGDPCTEAFLTNAVLNQSALNALMQGGYGFRDEPLRTLDMGGVDFLPLTDLSPMYWLDALEELGLAQATNLDGSRLVSLVGELDSLNRLDVTGPWDDFDVVTRDSLGSWDAIEGNTLVVPEPATIGLLAMGGAALLRRKRSA